MRAITVQNAGKFLDVVGLRIGSWCQVEAAVKSKDSSPSCWEKYRAPENAQELYSFAQHIAGWLPKGQWKMLQIDNSNAMDFAQTEFLRRSQADSQRAVNPQTDKTFLFEFDGSEKANQSQELLISDLIFMFLLWEGHGQFVSSTNLAAEYLSIQDGFVYFCSNERIRVNQNPVAIFEKNRRGAPSWVLQILESNNH